MAGSATESSEIAPSGFHSHHFTQWKLLSMLRARNGDVAKSTERAMACIEAVDLGRPEEARIKGDKIAVVAADPAKGQLQKLAHRMARAVAMTKSSAWS